MINSQKDYNVPLMRLLDTQEDRCGQARFICQIFEQKHRSELSPDQYDLTESGKIRWLHNLHWTRYILKEYGYIDSPSTGIWRLTQSGHVWLKEHPEASHLIPQKQNTLHKKASNSGLEEQRVDSQFLFGDSFFVSLQNHLKVELKSILGTVGYEFIHRSNYLQIRINGYRGCHYEIINRRRSHEIAIHFESSKERSQARLLGFEPHLEELSKALKMPLMAGKFQNRGWTQIKVERKRQMALEPNDEFQFLVLRFITLTFPILQRIYALEKKRKPITKNKNRIESNNTIHQILDQEIATIRDYLQGRILVQPEVEKLCDWIYLCYMFHLYAEANELFSMVIPDQVNPWYYERTKKIAKLCSMKAGN